jgi:UDP-N-acetylglucosamine--N-acetylmuramyl-(pentapeptide) pyrophosphoryl-undecaprenol N-acetylglucosamine transferase
VGVSERPTIFLAGGGSGGHVFPLLAVAQRLQLTLPNLEAIFIGTERGLETRLVPAAGYRLELISALPFRGVGVLGASRSLVSVAKALPRARDLLKRYVPRAVLSIGGYAAVPMALGAKLAGIPLALMEPNSQPGLAHRLAGPGAQRVYTAFEETKKYFRAGSVLETGVALRSGFVPRPYAWAGKGQPLRVLVLGGSQGARSLNDLVAPALSKAKVPLAIVHQVGRGNLLPLRQRYAELKRPGASVVEFIDDMAGAIANADLVISRAGAGAIAELCAIGRPSILVPLPISGDHQLHNAQGLEKAGGAVCLPAAAATPEALAERVAELARDPERLARMAESARAWGRPDAAQRICDDLLALAGLLTPEPAVPRLAAGEAAAAAVAGSSAGVTPAEPQPAEPKSVEAKSVEAKAAEAKAAAPVEAPSEAAPVTPAGRDA